jgi:hypothetical protein
MPTLTRNSFIGCGISSERICVTIALPSDEARTTVSPSLRRPFTRMQSIVVPRPVMAFTSSTVA